ncbi:MAG TPA: hypothetical protein PLQ98_00960 [Bacillota bacterium]|nr:hypothetical protein [Bacillota bacterium]
MKYTILELGKDTKVKFDHDDGSTSTQTIANLPINSKEALEAALIEYERAYVAGKELEHKQAAAEVQALVGKPQEVKEEPSNPE